MPATNTANTSAHAVWALVFEMFSNRAAEYCVGKEDRGSEIEGKLSCCSEYSKRTREPVVIGKNLWLRTGGAKLTRKLS